jgi:DNA invertase Pin-like site-specific DNA recombinase
MMQGPNLSGKRVAIYARYSSTHQREASIEDQIRRCTEYVRQHGGTVSDELVFDDKAVSGASLERPGFERMMAQVTGRPAGVDVIVSEDVSRITRDFADGATIFKQLQYLGVPLIGVADGTNTSLPNAKMTFALSTLMSDLYLETLRDKTMRGLEGRALAGLSTGGLPIGYRSEPITDSMNRVTGHQILIDPEGAATVKRIFSLYEAGVSQEAIARRLNDQKVPPPRAKTLHRRKGWVASTIRAILRNPAYIGEFTFKKKEWRKVPGTNVRRYRNRPESEVMHRKQPELRIIDEETWDAVQARVAAVRDVYTKTEDGRPRGPGLRGRTSYPFTGLLYCSECGAPMTICGGSSQKYYGCTDAKKRGTCKNNLSVREDVVRIAMLRMMREELTGPKELKELREAVAAELGDLGRQANAELDERRARLRRTEEHIAGLIKFIAQGDESTYVRQTLKDLELQAKTEKRAIEEVLSRRSAPVRIPSPEEIVERALRLEKSLFEDPAGSREELRKMFEGQRVIVRPQPERFYMAEGVFLPLAAFATPLLDVETPKARDSGESSGLPALLDREPEFACSSLSCAGRI